MSLAVFKIASVTLPSVVLTCTDGDQLVKQSQDHPVHIPRLRVRVLPRTPALLIIPSAVDPPARERARPSRSRCSAPPDERS